MLSLFCDVEVVEIFILRLVHLESGMFDVGEFFFEFRLGLLNLGRNGLCESFISFLLPYIHG